MHRKAKHQNRRPQISRRPAQDDRVRDLVLDAYARVLREGGYASDLLAQAFRRREDLGPRARATANRRLFGMIHLARKLDFALEAAGARLTRDTEVYAKYVAFRLLKQEISIEEAREALPVVNWKAVAEIDAAIARESSPVLRLALKCSLPDLLAERFLEEYGDEAEALGSALNEAATQTLRANTLKVTRAELAERLTASGVETRSTRFAPHGLSLSLDAEPKDRSADMLRSARSSGLFEPQDEGSQLVSELAACALRAFLKHASAKTGFGFEETGGIAVDFCAGAGGKTLPLGAAMNNRGRLFALTLKHHDYDELRRRADRAGLENLTPVLIERNTLPRELHSVRGKAICVLVDAPCSGVGALRRKPEVRWRITAEALQRLPAEQLDILKQAARLCAPGGYLIYATCTVLRAENEAVAAEFLNQSREFALVSARTLFETVLPKKGAARVTDATGQYLKLLPHQQGTDGFFAAVFQKSPEGHS